MKIVTKRALELEKAPLQGANSGSSASFGLHFLIILLAAILAHGLSLKAGFYMDDFELILKKESLQEGAWHAPEFAWRWIPYFIFSAILRVFGGSSIAFHCVNLILHLGISCLVFAAGRDIFQRLSFSRTDEARTNAAFIGALVFACHPMCSEAVNYARCAMIEFVTLFSVLATWFAVRYFEPSSNAIPVQPGDPKLARRWGILMVAAIVLAACSKNPGLLHALGNVGLVCLAASGYRQLSSVLKWRLAGKRWLLVLPLFLVVGYLSYTWSMVVRAAVLRWQEIYLMHTLTQGRIFWEYVERIVFPYHLSSDHYIAWSSGFADLEAVLKTAALFLVSAAAFAGLFLKRFRVVALLLCLALAPLQMRFLYAVKELMVEYRTYPAMPWVGLLAGIGIGAIYERRRMVGTVAAAALIGTCIALSAARSTVWSSWENLAENVSEQYPLNGRAITHLQGVAFRSGDFARVIALKKDMDEATRLNEKYNSDHKGWRRYANVRAQEDFCNSEQLVVFALAHWQGDEAALRYADRRLATLCKELPQFYVDPRTGGFHPQNSLVKARLFVKNRLELSRGS